MTHLYNGPLIVQSMMLNRRSNDKSLRVNSDGTENIYETMGLQGTLPGSPSPSGDTLVRFGNTQWVLTYSIEI